MSRNLKLYLSDILKSIKKIERYTKGMNYKQLVADELTYDAVVYNLQIIGEAAKNIPLLDQFSISLPRNIKGKKARVQKSLHLIFVQWKKDKIWDTLCPLGYGLQT